MEAFDDTEGVWRTIGGRKVFIRNGQTLAAAMKASGKFPSAKTKTCAVVHMVLPTKPPIRQVDEHEFADTIAKAKDSLSPRNAWRVDANDASAYKDSKCFVSDGGSCVAVEKTGNIVSVCKKPGDTVSGSDLMKHAVANGGDRLDAFGPGLYRFYTKNGFEPVSWTPFNPAYAPKGWIPGVDIPEPIIFYKHTGKKTPKSYGAFLLDTAPNTGPNGYHDAMKARDKEI